MKNFLIDGIWQGPPNGFDVREWLNEAAGWFARGWYNTQREAFAILIDKVSGRGTWERNPWVVVCEFELVK